MPLFGSFILIRVNTPVDYSPNNFSTQSFPFLVIFFVHASNIEFFENSTPTCHVRCVHLYLSDEDYRLWGTGPLRVNNKIDDTQQSITTTF